MCLCGVIGCSGQVDQTLRSVLPTTEQLSYDRTLTSVWSALTGRVRSQKLPSEILLMLTELWHLASSHITVQRPVSTDRTRPIRILPL